MKTILIVTALLASVSLPITALAAAADSVYAVRQEFKLGPSGKWDYAAIDDVRHRLYLSRGDHVQVLQLPSGAQVAEIADTPHVHAFAFAQDLKLGFISNGARDSVTVIDLDTMKKRDERKVSGKNPDALLYEPRSHKLFVFNGKSHDVTVMDAVTLQVVATIPVSGRPEFAVSDDAGRVFVNIEDNAGVDVIDVASNTVTARWKLDGCDEPAGLAIDTAHQRLFSACQNKIMAVTDSTSGKRIANVVIGEHPDAAVFDPETARIFTSNGGGNGSLTVVHEDDPDHYTVLSNLSTRPGAKTMAFDKVSKNVYLPAAVKETFTVVVAAPR
jgi:YVTN family beta-propeller protein